MLKKTLFIFSILLSSCSNLTLKSNEFDTFSDSYTNIFGENPSQVWVDKDSCRSCTGHGGDCNSKCNGGGSR